LRQKGRSRVALVEIGKAAELNLKRKALLFVNKKKQKNFDFLATLLKPAPPPTHKSFLVLFFKKEPLSKP